MEIDFQAIKALSSPTRVTLLKELVDNPSTTTDLSDNLDMSKSTVSDHLTRLHEAGLVEKEDKEGRRRVMYKPTRRARHIIKGSRRKMQFSLTAATAFLIGGFISITRWIGQTEQTGDTGGTGGGEMGPGIMTEETQDVAEPGLIEQILGYIDSHGLVILGAIFIVFSMLFVYYAMMQRRLGRASTEE